jgi:glucosamine-6-phosphate deaminase
VEQISSAVEQAYLNKSGRPLRYPPEEKIDVLVVDSFPELGRLTALRFLEWVSQNPEGVVSLPTGKTPEYFIKEVQRLLSTWKQKPTRQVLEAVGLGGLARPSLRGLRFVQIDEFYPINPLHHNSFHHYVKRFYVEGFGLDPDRCLLIDAGQIGLPHGLTLDEVWDQDEVDLTLRYRHARGSRERLQKHVLERIDQHCVDYEARIRELGGIGFFLGGIGPDGHIGFNVRGSDLYSTTRLAPTNYETQAAAALDLGGIEISRKRRVITIGLETITSNPACVAIIMAAGEAKKKIVADSVTGERDVRHPATALQVLPNARFYLTRGAAVSLSARRRTALLESPTIAEEESDRILIDISLETHRPLKDLTQEDLEDSPFGRVLLDHGLTPAAGSETAGRLKERIQAGMTTMAGKTFLHTEPHHDDVMLGYMPLVVRHIRDWSTVHHFVTLTSGFNAVTNSYMLERVTELRRYIETPEYLRLLEGGYFAPANLPARNRDVWHYLDGVAAPSATQRRRGEMRRLARNLIEVYDETDPGTLENRVTELINYFETQYPGRKDLPHIQRLKGMCREWESDCLWGYFGWDGSHVHHARLGFYKGDIFTEEPTVDRDVLPLLELLERTNPDVVTVALDPEASGPDTHYKVMQALSAALKMHQEKTGRDDIAVLGYRNVWYRFHLAEANLYVPVSLNMLNLQHSAFMNTFISQKDASFPSHEHDGPFSELAQRIQVEQYRNIRTCLGESWFADHSSALIRATRGMVLLKQLSLEEFYSHSRALRESIEAPAEKPLD